MEVCVIKKGCLHVSGNCATLMRIRGFCSRYCFGWRSHSPLTFRAVAAKTRRTADVVSPELKWMSLPARHFDDILSNRETHPTSAVYDGIPLSTLDPCLRGLVLGDLARSIDAEIHPSSASQDSNRAEHLHGNRCYRRPRAGYDWLRGDVRVKCKSAMLKWAPSSKRWFFKFSGVKMPCPDTQTQSFFDELWLVLYTPENIYFYLYDGKFGLSTCGVRTKSHGHEVRFYGPQGVKDWRRSLYTILSKLDGVANECSLLRTIPVSDNRVDLVLSARPANRMQLVFQGLPLSGMTPAERGLRIQEVVRRVDGMLNPASLISDPLPGRAVNGRCRHQSQAEYDWDRDGLRIECKSGQLTWASHGQHWELCFANVKLGRTVEQMPFFNELHLAVYAPQGIFIWKHDLLCGLQSRGLVTCVLGYQIRMKAPRSMTDWRSALSYILDKMDKRGCTRIAYVRW